MEGAARDARLLLECAVDRAPAAALADPGYPLGPEENRRFQSLVGRRADREPMSQILGRKGFWSIVLEVDKDVLTPRPETETLVEAALEAFPPGRAFRLADLGTGSGAILLAILGERPFAQGFGIDKSPAAARRAARNAQALGLAARSLFLCGDWAGALADGLLDLAISNPPYVASGDIAGLPPEVRDYEPRVALDGGADGLAAYRRLAGEMLRVLKPGGVFVLEIDPFLERSVLGLMDEAGAGGVVAKNDLSGRPRAVVGLKKGLG